MTDAASYRATAILRDGRTADIRAFSPDDQAALTAAVASASSEALYRRFFTVKRRFSERERDFFLNVDFIDHVALMAWVEDAGQRALAGGGRFVVVEPGKAEVAFMVVDAYQGRGIGGALMQHLAVLARAAGLKSLVAEVLPENRPMLKVFARSGLTVTTKEDYDVVHVTMQLT